MINYRKESLFWFTAMGGITATAIIFIVFGFDQIITYIFIGFATFFSGMWGYILGNKFSTLDKKSKYKAMLLGSSITLLAVITSAIVSALTSIFVLEAITPSAKDSNIIFDTFSLAGVSILFSAPITIPIGALAGYFVHKPCDDEQSA